MFPRVGAGMLTRRGLGAPSLGSALARRSSMPTASWQPFGRAPALDSRVRWVARPPLRVGRVCRAALSTVSGERDDLGARLLDKLKLERVSAETLELASLVINTHAHALAAHVQTIAAKDSTIAAKGRAFAAAEEALAAWQHARRRSAPDASREDGLGGYVPFDTGFQIVFVMLWVVCTGCISTAVAALLKIS